MIPLAQLPVGLSVPSSRDPAATSAQHATNSAGPLLGLIAVGPLSPGGHDRLAFAGALQAALTLRSPMPTPVVSGEPALRLTVPPPLEARQDLPEANPIPEDLLPVPSLMAPPGPFPPSWDRSLLLRGTTPSLGIPDPLVPVQGPPRPGVNSVLPFGSTTPGNSLATPGNPFPIPTPNRELLPLNANTQPTTFPDAFPGPEAPLSVLPEAGPNIAGTPTEVGDQVPPAFVTNPVVIATKPASEASSTEQATVPTSAAPDEVSAVLATAEPGTGATASPTSGETLAAEAIADKFAPGPAVANAENKSSPVSEIKTTANSAHVEKSTAPTATEKTTSPSADGKLTADAEAPAKAAREKLSDPADESSHGHGEQKSPTSTQGLEAILARSLRGSSEPGSRESTETARLSASAPSHSLPTTSPVAAPNSPAARPTSVLAPPPIAEQVSRAVLVHAEIIRTEGRVEFRLHLEPPELGTVRVQLRLTEQTLSARLIVHDVAAQHLIEGQIESLRQRLMEMGLSVGQFDVSCDRGNGQQQGDRWARSTWPAPHEELLPSALDHIPDRPSLTHATLSTTRVDVMV